MMRPDEKSPGVANQSNARETTRHSSNHATNRSRDSHALRLFESSFVSNSRYGSVQRPHVVDALEIMVAAFFKAEPRPDDQVFDRT